MSDQPRPRPLPGGRPFEVEHAKPAPRELPRAPERTSSPMTLSQIAAVVVLVVVALAVIGVLVLGLPLAMIGGKAIILVPAIAVMFFMKGKKR